MREGGAGGRGASSRRPPPPRGSGDEDAIAAADNACRDDDDDGDEDGGGGGIDEYDNDCGVAVNARAPSTSDKAANRRATRVVVMVILEFNQASRGQSLLLANHSMVATPRVFNFS